MLSWKQRKGGVIVEVLCSSLVREIPQQRVQEKNIYSSKQAVYKPLFSPAQYPLNVDVDCSLQTQPANIAYGAQEHFDLSPSLQPLSQGQLGQHRCFVPPFALCHPAVPSQPKQGIAASQQGHNCYQERSFVNCEVLHSALVPLSSLAKHQFKGTSQVLAVSQRKLDKVSELKFWRCTRDVLISSYPLPIVLLST